MSTPNKTAEQERQNKETLAQFPSGKSIQEELEEERRQRRESKFWDENTELEW